MESFLFFGAVVLIVLFISVIGSIKRRKSLLSKKLTAPPWADNKTKQLFQKFNNAWSTEIEKTVNMRIKKVNYTLTVSELSNQWYELKKFLFLAGTSKGLPMFSTQIDNIWHFFLEEKQLYNDFCLAFIGEQIDHHPHETPKHLPAERAWFDILYLSFFNITSHSHLWGEFMQEKKEVEIWIERIMTEPKEIVESSGRQFSGAALTAFLIFAQEQMLNTDKGQGERIKRADGYWYGAVLFSIYSYDTIQVKKKKEGKNSTTADGSGGFIGYTDSSEDEWNKIVTDVNSFESGAETGTTSSGHSDGGSSDSGSSCSSCSGCSS